MMRSLRLSFALLLLTATLAWADGPGVQLEFIQGMPIVRLQGSYAGQSYRVLRADPGTGQSQLVSDDALCTGDCYVVDRTAILGATYEYTFLLSAPDGTSRSFGPYAVTFGHAVEPGAKLALSPNPTRRGTRIRVDAARAAADPAARILGQPGEVMLLDVRGRVVSRVWSGTVGALTFDVAFDGRDGRGAPLAPGLYFAHFRSGGLAATSRLVVTR